MILELACQSIQAKLRLKSATMLGNYEFYYAAGILARELNLSVEAGVLPKDLYDYIRSQTDGREFENPTVTHLVKMIFYYKIEEQYDAQMQELFELGRSGK